MPLLVLQAMVELIDRMAANASGYIAQPGLRLQPSSLAKADEGVKRWPIRRYKPRPSLISWSGADRSMYWSPLQVEKRQRPSVRVFNDWEALRRVWNGGALV